MNQLRYALPLIFFVSSMSHTKHQKFNIILEPMWHNLNHNSKHISYTQGKWVLVGSITFKKHAKEYLTLNRMIFNWQGTPIENLTGSLYKKMPDKNFMAIEDNLVCDGCWNKTHQKLILNFDQKQTLGPTTTFYLVLTVPDTIEPRLHHGSFTIEKQTLPEPFQKAIGGKQLSLALSTAIPQESPLA